MRINSYFGIQRQIGISKAKVDRALLQLSTQKKINSAADDSVGSAALSRIKSTLSSLKQVNEKNISAGESALDSASDTSAAIYSKLEDLHDLAEQAADGGLTDPQRADLNIQFQQGLADIDALVASTTSNGRTLLDGTYSVKLQVGSESGQTQTIAFGSLTKSALDLSSQSIGTQSDADKALAYVTNAYAKVSTVQSKIGSYQKSLDFRKNANAIQMENLEEARSNLEDLDLPEAVSNLSLAQTQYSTQLKLLQNALSTQQDAWSLLFAKN